MIHELKIWPQYYARVKDGSKTFEIRENDRGYQPGDEVILKEFDPDMVTPIDKTIPKGYTEAPNLRFTVGYVFVLDSSTVVFSLLPPPKRLEKKKKASK